MVTGVPVPRKYISLKDLLESAESVPTETKELMMWRNIAGASALGILIGAPFYIGYLQSVDFYNIFVIGRVLIWITIIVLAAGWMYNGASELDYLQTWIRTGHYRKKRPFTIVVTFIVLSGFFAILVLNSGHVYIFFLLYAGYLVIDVGAWKLRRDEIKPAIKWATEFLKSEVETRSNLDTAHDREADIEIGNIYVQTIKIIQEFYFERSQITRVMVTFLPVALLTMTSYKLHLDILSGTQNSYFGIFEVEPSSHQVMLLGFHIDIDWLRFTAYSVYIVTMIVSEYVLSTWRNKMRQGLLDLRDKLFEMEKQ